MKASETEQSGDEEASRTGTEPEHEAHTQGGVPGRDEVGGAVARTHCFDRSGLSNKDLKPIKWKYDNPQRRYHQFQ